MTYESFLELILKGGTTIFVLIFCSIWALKVIIEKYVSYRGIKEDYIEGFTNAVKLSLSNRNHREAVSHLDKAEHKWFIFRVNNPLANVFKHMIEKEHYTKEELMETSFTKLDKEISKMEKGLGVLATLGSISPFIGLFGTVIGIIKAFSAFSMGNTQSYSGVISGIAEALIATAAGLFVAVPSVLFYNYFTKKLRLSMPMFDEAINDVARILKRD